jgi:hypothetical protein
MGTSMSVSMDEASHQHIAPQRNQAKGAMQGGEYLSQTT